MEYKLYLKNIRFLKSSLLFAILFFCFGNISFAQRTYISSTPAAGSYQIKIPCDVTSIIVECWGAGGGGGGASGNTSGGGGGAGGAYARKVLIVVPGSTIIMVAGLGGSGGATSGTNGGNGADSYFNNTTIVKAVGGTGGSGATTANTSGAGANALIIGNVGDVNFYGGSGGTGTSGTSGGGGGSAGSTNSGGNGAVPAGGTGGLTGGGSGGNGGVLNGVGNSGSYPGGGGGGGRKNTNNIAGGKGADGKIIITFDSYLAGYCTPAFPSGIEPITHVTFAGINNASSPSTSGSLPLEVYCDMGIVVPGSSYPISVQGNTDGPYINKILVYIDWNRDQMIDANELTNLTDLINSTGADGKLSTGTILVPPGTTPGKVFMRVLKKFDTAPIPCNTTGYGQAEDYMLEVIIPTPCAGTPVAGTPSASPATGDPSSTFTLSSSGSSINSGITYQWQSSPNGSTGWVDIPGATTLSYNATAVGSITTTYYRLIIKCANGGLTATSSTTSFITSCSTPAATNNSVRYIQKVSFIGTLNDVTNTSTYSATGYQDFSALPNKAKQAQNDGVNVYVESNLRATIRAWVDWNKNGAFETSEMVYDILGYVTTTTTFGFVVPGSAAPGDYKIRIRTYNDFDFAVPIIAFGPCGTISNGETEDYLFTVVAECPTRITGGADVERCGSGSVNLTVSGGPGTPLFSFYSAQNGGTLLGTSTSGTWATPDISTSTVYYVSTCPSQYRTPVKVTIKDIPVLSFTPVNPVVCGEGAVLQLDASGTTETGVLIDEKFESGLGSFYANMLGGNYPAAQWTTVTSTYVPPATPIWRPAISSGFAGNSFAYITSDVENSDINNALQLINNVSTVGYTSLVLEADIFYDHYLPDGNNGVVDRFFVEISTNGGTIWTVLENNNADIGIGTKMFHKIYNLTNPSYLGKPNVKIRFRFLAQWTNGAAIDNIKLSGFKPLAPSYSWSPTTGGNLFLDAGGSSPYLGGSVANVFVKPTAAQLLAGSDLNFTATASLSNGCSATAPVTVKIGPSTWVGSLSNQWHDPNNWCSKTVPSATTIVEIPSPSTNMPVITTNAIAKNILVKSGATLTISAGASLTVNGIFNNVGTLANNGRITLNGTAPQTFPGTGTISAMSEVEIANSTGVTLNKTFILSTQLIPTLGTLNLANYDISLLSNASKTASVAAIGVNADFAYGGGGRFVVQRHIATGAHGKGWQLLSSPLKEGQTIYNAWQNGGVNTAGKGTLIHHNLYNGTNGFDVGVAVGPSIKSYNYVTNEWTIYPNNTNSSNLDNPHGYLLFVRGDRTVVFPANPTSPTVLSNRGKIYTRTAGFTPASISVNAGKFESAGNPYASQIDFTNLTRTGGVDNKFYVWDPLLLGAYKLGGYQVISASSGWKPVPGSTYYPAGNVKKTIESGQAFLVFATGTSGTIGFTEAAKSVGSNLVNRPEDNSQLQILRSNLMTDNFEIADGNAVSFHQNFSNGIDADDASKIMNSGENFGIVRNLKTLAIEARSLVVSSDTIFYLLKKPVLNKTYKLVFEPENMDVSLNAELLDNYLKTRSVVSMTAVTTLNVNFSNDADSYKEDRFMLVFNRGIAGPLPVTFVSISAVKNNREVEVKWKVENEINLQNYIVERSNNGRSFVEIGNVLPSNVNEYTKIDFDPLASDNYYRIKALTVGGLFQYSAIVKVAANEMISSINVYPNPLVNTSVNIQFLNQQKGKYSLKIINNLGQVIYRSDENVTGSNVIKNIELSKVTGAGIYNLVIRKPDGASEIIQMIKK